MEPYQYNTKNGKRYRVAFRKAENNQNNKCGFTPKVQARACYRRKMG